MSLVAPAFCPLGRNYLSYPPFSLADWDTNQNMVVSGAVLQNDLVNDCYVDKLTTDKRNCYLYVEVEGVETNASTPNLFAGFGNPVFGSSWNGAYISQRIGPFGNKYSDFQIYVANTTRTGAFYTVKADLANGQDYRVTVEIIVGDPDYTIHVAMYDKSSGALIGEALATETGEIVDARIGYRTSLPAGIGASKITRVYHHAPNVAGTACLGEAPTYHREAPGSTLKVSHARDLLEYRTAEYAKKFHDRMRNAS